MRRVVTGEEIAQLRNPDPFAVPAWRSPVYRTPLAIVAIVHFVRMIVWLVRVRVRPPGLVVGAVLGVWMWRVPGWLGLVVLAVSIAAVLIMWWWRFRVSFSRFVAGPARGQWRAWHYRRRWAAVMTIGRLAPVYQGRVMLPVLGKVSATRFTDRVQVRLVSGQSAADFAARADNLAHGFGAMLCRIRSASPGALVLEFVRRDALAAIIPALAIPARVDLRALPTGRREDGQAWLVRVHGTHVLIAGATGAGKASLLWSIIRALLPAMAAGLVRVWAADPKLMELAYGRAIFDRYGARDRGALADVISTDETTGAGVAYVRLATDPDPVRVRAAWVTDADIRAMAAKYAPPEKVRPLRADAA
ncbi:MAG: FtsK/SpoIIIE domain-containing protein [Streptosporangiaceae bacterium]